MLGFASPDKYYSECPQFYLPTFIQGSLRRRTVALVASLQCNGTNVNEKDKSLIFELLIIIIFKL